MTTSQSVSRYSVSRQKLVARGRTSAVYELGRHTVVKVPSASVPGTWAAIEARKTAEVRALGGPAPTVIELAEIDGRAAIVFERVDGPSLWDLLSNGDRTASSVGIELADIHRGILGLGLPSGIGGAAERMKEHLANVGALDTVEQREASGIVDELPAGAALLHGDLHPGNVLMGTDGPVVIDWFDAAIGHPVTDVVRASLLFRPFAANAQRPHLPGATTSALNDLHRAYVTAMAPVLAPVVDRLARWEAVVAACRLAERAEPDNAALLRSWRSRNGRSSLAELVESAAAGI